MLREVKYLEIRAEEEIPPSAAAMYSKNEMFRKFLANLDLTVQWYNKVRRTVLEVEFPLIEGQLQDIDVQLEQAEKSLNWESEGEDFSAEYINDEQVAVAWFGKKGEYLCEMWYESVALHKGILNICGACTVNISSVNVWVDGGWWACTES